jgi:tetratricopeptide (TPR) repeat protein
MKTSAVYTARDVAQIIGLQESRVRYWAQTGFIGPSERVGGRAVYTFADLVGVRAAKELLERGVSLQHARRSLEALKAQLPGIDRPLTQLRVISNGDRLVVTGDAPFEALSGQLVMNFALGELEGRIAELFARGEPAAAERGATAYAWFLEGIRLDVDPARGDEALIAYQKAVDADPHLAAAHTNMGRLLCQRGALAEARQAYAQALALDPDQPEARYNLGNLLDELGEREQAIAEWIKVVCACPEFADAHFHLAAAYAAPGTEDRARRHLVRYLELDADGPWADRARALLETLPAV